MVYTLQVHLVLIGLYITIYLSAYILYYCYTNIRIAIVLPYSQGFYIKIAYILYIYRHNWSILPAVHTLLELKD